MGIRKYCFGGLVAALAVSGCAERDVTLPGKREDIRAPFADAAPEPVALRSAANRTVPISLPQTSANSEWLQRIGTPQTRVAHPALGAGQTLIWSTPIGAGDGRRNRVTADPVVAGGRVFTLDSEAQVSAVSTGGALLWSRDLVPETDRADDATGGGLAYGDGKLFVSSGFGRLTALDPATGAELWVQKLEATGSGSPAVRDGIVYLVAGDSTAWALDADTGRIKWQLTGTPDVHNVMGGPAPAISDQYAIFAFGSGELQGAFRQGGLRMWDALVAGQRPGLSRTRVADITGDPVISGDRVYVGSHSGRLVALGLANGARLWTADEGAMSPVWPAGGSVFLVSDRNEVVRLDADTGERIWGTQLPLFVKKRPRRQKAVYAHHGPVLAGGRLIVASSDGYLRSFDPASGTLTGQVEIPGGATTNPVVAGGTVYVVSTKGQLHAFR